jgi:hypothetical protein
MDHWILMAWFDTTYLKRYLANGPLIGMVTAIASLVWGDRNRPEGLISAHPSHPIGACLQLVGLPIDGMGAQVVRPQDPAAAPQLFDRLLAIVFLRAVVGLMLV